MALYQCYDDKFEYIIKCHGITKDPVTKEVMFIMKYANGGDLHNYLQENFTEITWKKKLYILWRISDGYPYKKYIYGNDTVYIWFIYVFINSVLKFRIFNKDLIFCDFIKTRYVCNLYGIFKPYMQIIHFAYVIYKPHIYIPYTLHKILQIATCKIF